MAPLLDLREHPFTDMGSRLLVLAHPDRAGLRVLSAEYERRADECRVLPRLLLRTAGGDPVPVEGAYPQVVRFAGGATLAFADAETLSLGLPAGEWRIDLDLVGDPVPYGTGGTARTDLDDRSLTWRVDGGHVDQPAGSGVRLLVRADQETRLVLAAGPDRDVPGHAAVVAAAARRWDAWFRRRPPVRADLAAMADLAWWVLGANQVRLRHDPARSMVVPSKLGYVGAWQWDSYFVAVGLRHGAPDLAWDQIAMFLDHQLPDGLIPDVVSDAGVLASVDDLPAGDLETLRTHLGQALPGEGGAALSGTVPVTKPPLTAWALRQVQRLAPDSERLAWASPRIAASQTWWATRSDTDRDGLSEYLHPYSSGLDDSPLFDHGVPAETPDLNSYLVVQDDLLALAADSLGDPGTAARHRAAAERRTARLLSRRWDAARGRFAAVAAGRELDTLTPFHLMPLLTGRLPEPVVDRLVDTLTDENLLWGTCPLPTVAYHEPTFDPERMWRGPVWLNVNRLVAEGLVASGRTEIAAELVERSLAMVVDSGGPYEHWNPLTGARAASATSCFAWSAALFVDLAVAATDGGLSSLTAASPPT